MSTQNTKTPATPEELRRQRETFLTKFAEVVRNNRKEDQKTSDKK